MDKINGRNIIMESYDKIKKTLAIAFMHVLDANRPEGKMCLSNGECANIEKAFNEQDWPRLAGYLDKYTESEDEKTRKAIVELLKEVEEDETYTGRQHIPDMLSYLEKQKEQSHLLHPQNMDYEKVLGERKFPTYEQLKTGLLRLIDEGKISREDASRLLPELRESEDERIRKSLYTFFQGMLEGNEDCYKVGGFVKFEDIDVKSILAWLEKQKEQEHICDSAQYEEGFKTGLEIGLRKQKPAEWSEEDKNMWTHLNGYLNGFSCSEDAIKQMADWFYELPHRFNLQPKQEWGEEDEKMLKSAIWHISNSVTNGKNTDCKCDLTEWLMNKLKSLRPSWKPGEEQMKALSNVIEYCRAQANIGYYFTARDIPLLEQLVRQLNKL